MDHEAVVRKKMTEKYLLNELGSEARDEFEEHYFDCPECAFDVRAGSVFVERAKSLLTEASVVDPVVSPAPPSSHDFGWLSWLEAGICGRLCWRCCWRLLISEPGY